MMKDITTKQKQGKKEEFIYRKRLRAKIPWGK